MEFHSNFSLKNYNTFGIDVKAKKFVSISTLEELKEVLSIENEIFLLSGGSNMLLTKDIDKTVVHIDLKGITILEESNDQVVVEVYAGEDWHQFVLWCVNHDFGGIENLSLIPGNVGTCPIQNIGAYGVEVKDVIESVETIEIKSGKTKTFSNSECEFGYRNSIFKNTLKGKFVITKVRFKLTKVKHNLNTSYGAIESELSSNNIQNPTIKDISNAVIAIRQSKLPDPKEIGNSGSFFKNPVISKSHFERLQEKYPKIPSYPIDEFSVKVPAGWLIETAGFKGKRFGEAGIHDKQALVLVNHGNACGQEVFKVAKHIQSKIYIDFGIELEIEVNVY
ncbi:MAG: UDP-N-acetylmuramate dehydrogenase [Polaribacter sp.]